MWKSESLNSVGTVERPSKFLLERGFPRMTIVTPSLNQGRFLEDTITSVLSQNYPNLEYIVIDGGSTDESLEIIKKYSDRLTYYVSEPDRGHGHALNKGFERATGDIMAWLNSDDKYVPGAFQTAAEIFTAHPDIEWITGHHSLWNEDGTHRYYDNPDSYADGYSIHRNIYDFLAGSYEWIQQESTFWRRSLWERAGGLINEDYRLMVDGELWCRFFLYAELWHVDKILAGYRVHSNNRAAVYRKEVIAEMERAVSELERRCHPELLPRAEQLKHLYAILKTFDRFRLSGLLEFMFRGVRLCDGIHYQQLVHRDGSWAKTSLPVFG